MADDAANGDQPPAPGDGSVVAPGEPIAQAPSPDIETPPVAADASELQPSSAAGSAPSAAHPSEQSVPSSESEPSFPEAPVLPPESPAETVEPSAEAEGGPGREPRPSPYARSEPFVQERGLYTPTVRARPHSALQRMALLGLGFLGPSAVIALSLYFIVKGDAPHEGLVARAGAPGFAPDAGNLPPATEGPDEEGSSAPGAPTGSGAASLEAAPMVAVPGFEDEGNDEEPAPAKPALPKHFNTVQEAALGSCSTESVDGLSRQIIEQARCLKPNDFVALPKRPNLILKPQVFPYLEMAARDHLLKVLDAHPKQSMTINSALRTVAQQYLVSHWAATKICGVQLATRPGESNHEIGSALDIAEAAQWRPALEAQQFRWLGASDRVHFDYKGDNSGPRTATDVLAFQKLWNRNHAEDLIAETGLYGAPTEQRLKKSPPSGFPLGSSCRPTARKR